MVGKGYSLIKREAPKEPYFLVKVCGDSNDADYITEETKLSVDEWENQDGLLTAQIIDQFYSDSHKLRDMFSEIIDLPRDYNCDVCHTLESMEIEYVDVEGIVYDVKLDEVPKEIVDEVERDYDGDYAEFLDARDYDRYQSKGEEDIHGV